MIKQDKLVDNLCRISAELCSYTNIPCDCKYIKESDEKICSLHEEGSGCPETMLAALIIDNLYVEEFNQIIERINHYGKYVISMIKSHHKLKQNNLRKQIQKMKDQTK